MTTINLPQFRQSLHQYPELSHKEQKTAETIIKTIKTYSNPDKLLTNIGGHGIIATYHAPTPGKHIMIRCELDAVAVDEHNTFDYKSKVEGVSHKCGHDGHMTMVIGLLHKVDSLESGTVSLLFQPAEENGEGAECMLEDALFEGDFDYVFALHNMPGHPLGEIVVKEGVFSAASSGLIVKLIGKTTHAAEPQDGVSPALAMAQIVEMLHFLPDEGDFEGFVLVTVIHALLGEIAFGIAPGYAEVRATLRTFSNVDYAKLEDMAREKAKMIADKYGLEIEISTTEAFSATTNTKYAVDTIRSVALEHNYSITELTEPKKWSEDFGRFTDKYEGAMFGLGSGIDQPQLHNQNYDFPDEILETGTTMFWGIIQKLTSQ